MPETSMRRSAFTLMELLMVITIIMILMGMIFAGVGMTKRAAKKAKTESLMMQVRTALENYKQVKGFYPERSDANNPDYEAAFGGSAPWPDFKNSTIIWSKANERLAIDLNLAGETFPTQIKDSWGNILHYRPAKYYPYLNATGTSLIDSETPPSPDSYQLWSMGPNGTDEGATLPADDEVTSWVRTY